MRCLIGLDDTDSRFGHCTTHLGFLVAESLAKKGCAFETYPRLVRLNPNVPFKTRGNAAVCLEFETDDPDSAFQTAHRLLLANADVENGANSGLVFVEGSPSPFFRDLYSEAVSGLVNYRKVMRRLSDEKVRFAVLGNGMGLVGAAASFGFHKEDDHTYELIAYRTRRSCGTPRMIDPNSVIEMERRTFPHTFNSYDYGHARVLIAPHGPDPVFLGVRADSPRSAMVAFSLLRYDESLAGSMVYLTNQCTDAHLSRRLILEAKAYHSGWLEGLVGAVEHGAGGHFYLEIEVDDKRVKCAIYEPSGDLRRMANLLIVGDRVRIYGGVRRSTTRHGTVVNVEKIEVLSIHPSIQSRNPNCESCGRRMKSEGRAKGFQCRRCGRRVREAARISVKAQRDLTPGIYLPSVGAQRHLTKQLIRYGVESMVHPLVEGWLSSPRHSPSIASSGPYGPQG